MSRILLTSAIASVLATASLAQMWIPSGTYCGTPSLTVIADGQFLALWNSNSASGCKKIYAYSVGTGGNITLNELANDDCGQYGDDSVTFMRWEAPATLRVSTLNGNYGTPYEAALTTAQCPAATSDNMVSNTYCSANWDRFTASRNYYLWLSPDTVPGGWCVQAGRYSLSGNGLNDEYAYWCSTSAGPNVNNFWYSGSTELWLSYQLRGSYTATILSSAACASARPMTPIGSPLCMGGSVASPGYQNTFIVAMNASTYYISGANRYGNGNQWTTGGYVALGNMIGLNITDNRGKDDVAYLLGTKYFSDNTTMVLQDTSNRWFEAGTCMNMGGAFPSGTYCGGINAKLVIGGNNFMLWGDWDAKTPQCLTTGRIRNTTGGALVDLVRTSGCEVAYLYPKFYQVNDSIVATITRNNMQETYTFRMDFCMANTTTPTPAMQVPSGSYCYNISGVSAMMVVENGTFLLTMNSTNSRSWLSSTSPCAFSGWLTHRNGLISPFVQTSKCTYSSPIFEMLNMKFVDGQITFTLKNSTDNNTVTSMTCPAAGASPLGVVAPGYCPIMATGDNMAPQWYASFIKLWVWGDLALFTSGTDRCVSIYTITGMNGNVGYLTPQINNCGSTYKYLTKLANGDLYFHIDGTLAATALSSASCVANYMPPAQVSGSFCGVVAASQNMTASPAPAPNNMTLSAVGGGMILGAAPGAHLSMAIGSGGQLLVSIEPLDGSQVCVFSGWATSYSTSIGFSARNQTGCTSNGWSINKILIGANGALTVTVQNSYYVPIDVAMSASTCTAWQAPGLASGEYCGGFGQNFATNAQWQQEAPFLVAGHIVWFMDVPTGTSYGPRTIIANVSATGTNVTITNSWYWNNLWTTTGPAVNSLEDRYVNLVGTSGLSLSSNAMSKAYNTAACMNQTWLGASSVLATSPIPALGGRMTALFQNGSYMIQWDGTYSGVSSYSYPCYMSGLYAMAGATQVSMTITQRNSNYCGSSFEVSSAWMGTDGSINFNLWYSGAWHAIALTSANCTSGPSGVPSGRLCTSPWQSNWVCNDRFFSTSLTASMPQTTSAWWAPTLSVGGFGNLTKTTNGTIAVWATASNYPFTLGIRSWSSLIWENGVGYNFDYRNTALSVISSALCSLPWDSQPLLVGGYCGYNSYTTMPSNMTFIALPDNRFVFRYEPPVSSTSSTKTCWFSGSMTYSQSTRFVSFSQIGTLNTDGCFFNSYSDSGARIRFTGGMFFNDSAKLRLWGSSYTVEGGSGSTVQTVDLELLAANCPTFVNAASLRATANFVNVIPSGLYWTQGAWLQSTLVVVGNDYGLHVNRGQATLAGMNVAVVGGRYTSLPTASLARGGMFVTMGSQANTAGNFINSTYNMSAKVVNIAIATGGTPSGVYSNNYITFSSVTLPLDFKGETEAQQKAQASAADDKKAEDDKKTGVIIGVIIAVVVVIAIIAVVVLKSRGGSSQPPTQSGGQDYRPMNSV